MAAASMGIGELASRTGVTARTIRFWEAEDILPPPPRTPGGTRRYPLEYALLVEGAVVLRDLGFGVEEMRLISLMSRGTELPEQQRVRTRRAIDRLLEQLDRKMRALEFVKLAASSTGPASMDVGDRARLAELLGLGHDRETENG